MRMWEFLFSLLLSDVGLATFRKVFFSHCPSVERTCQRQEIYVAFWHFEDVNNLLLVH